MSKTQVVIVYSPNTGCRRRTIVPIASDPDDWDSVRVPLHAANLQPGEAVMIGTLSDYHTMGPDAMLARYLGRPAQNERCAVIHHATGVVIGLIQADPKLFQHPDGHLLRPDPRGVVVIGQLARDLPLSL
jgi:hypothetical protein